MLQKIRLSRGVKPATPPLLQRLPLRLFLRLARPLRPVLIRQPVTRLLHDHISDELPVATPRWMWRQPPARGFSRPMALHDLLKVRGPIIPARHDHRALLHKQIVKGLASYSFCQLRVLDPFPPHRMPLRSQVFDQRAPFRVLHRHSSLIPACHGGVDLRSESSFRRCGEPFSAPFVFNRTLFLVI
jgi:hypothetical protein